MEFEPKNNPTPEQIETEIAGLKLLAKQINEEREKAIQRIEHFNQAAALAVEKRDLDKSFLGPQDELEEKIKINNLNIIYNKDIN